MLHSALTAGLALSLLASCGLTSEPRTLQSLDEKIARTRAEAAALFHERLELKWRHWRAGTPLDRATLFANREWLLSTATIQMVRDAARKEQEPSPKRALLYLHGFLLGERLGQTSAPIRAKIKELRTTASVDLGSKRIPYHQMRARLAAESDPGIRRQMAAAMRPITTELNRLLELGRQQHAVTARELGYGSLVSLAGDVRHFGIRNVAPLARRLLRQSRAMYLAALEELAPPLTGVAVTEMQHADLPKLVNRASWASNFTEEGLLPTAFTTLAGLGLPARSLPVHIDLRDHKDKDPRAVCFPVRVPHDIRVSLEPRGGGAAYAGFLQEIGRAIHFAYTTTPHFELQQLGDVSGPEALSLLFAGLTHDPSWLHDVLGMSEPELSEYLRRAALRSLIVVRRYAALVLVELELNAGRQNAERAYAEHLGRAYGFPDETRGFEPVLVEQDPIFIAAGYLRARLLEAQLTAELRQSFSERWWQNPEAGQWLRARWAQGQQPTGAELARSLGADGIEVEPLLERLAEQLVR